MQFEQEAVALRKTSISGSIYTLGGQQHMVPDYVSSLCARLSKLKVLYQSERRDPIGPADAQRLLSLRVKKGSDRLFRTFQTSVAALIGVEVDAFEEDDVSSQTRRSTGRQAKLDVDNFLVQANGSGIKEALRLMLNIELDEPNIMLIEEPEVHLHPALETSVMRYLKRRSESAQLFLTTHSTNFIDSGEYSSIFFVRKTASTSSLLLTTDQAADVLPEELGLRPSSLFMYEKLVFVEGPSDEDVIREWATTIQCNLSRANVGFIVLGGSRNIKHFAARKTTEFLQRRGVELWFVLDRDERSDANLPELQRQFGEGCRLRILPVREIENFLVTPGSLRRFVEGKISVAADRTNLSSLALSMPEVIDQSADELKAYALGKRILSHFNEPAYVNPDLLPSQSANELIICIKEKLMERSEHLSARVEEIDIRIAEITASFEDDWKLNKLNVCPGDELLQTVLRKFGLAYKKRRDAKQIASLMELSEIPQDVQNLLWEIAPAEV